MAHTICTFNVNNLYVRYRFGQTFPGDRSAASIIEDSEWGYLPVYDPDLMTLFNPEHLRPGRSQTTRPSSLTSCASKRWRASSPCGGSTRSTCMPSIAMRSWWTHGTLASAVLFRIQSEGEEGPIDASL